VATTGRLPPPYFARRPTALRRRRAPTSHQVCPPLLFPSCYAKPSTQSLRLFVTPFTAPALPPGGRRVRPPHLRRRPVRAAPLGDPPLGLPASRRPRSASSPTASSRAPPVHHRAREPLPGAGVRIPHVQGGHVPVGPCRKVEIFIRA